MTRSLAGSSCHTTSERTTLPCRKLDQRSREQQLNALRRECQALPITQWLAFLFVAPRVTDAVGIEGRLSTLETVRKVAIETPHELQMWELAIECLAATGGTEANEPWSDGYHWPGVLLLGFAQRAA